MTQALSDNRPINQGQDSVESVAIAGAAAIQRIIADRDELRNHVGSQQRDLMTLTALNEELRRQLSQARHHYVELGTRILAQIEQFDQAIRDMMRNHNPNPKVGSADDTSLVALAHRLKPANGVAKPDH